jgi:cell division transport system ATP-binding protein
MIRLTQVFKSYQSPVLENVQFTLNRGEFVYLVGDSGAGKTTFLKMLYGEEKPQRGSIEVLGEDLTTISPDKLQLLRRKVGVIFQDLKLIEDLSTYDNVALGLEFSEKSGGFWGTNTYRQKIEQALGLVGAQKLEKKKVKLLSGGERQRVAAARAIVRQPELILADEPTGSLDRDLTWSLMDLFQKLHLRGTTVLVATHDREIVRRVRRKSWILKSGKLISEDGLCML